MIRSLLRFSYFPNLPKILPNRPLPPHHHAGLAAASSNKGRHRSARPRKPFTNALLSITFFPGGCTSSKSSALPSAQASLRALPTSSTLPPALDASGVFPSVTTRVVTILSRSGSASPSKSKRDQVPGQPAKPRTLFCLVYGRVCGVIGWSVGWLCWDGGGAPHSRLAKPRRSSAMRPGACVRTYIHTYARTLLWMARAESLEKSTAASVAVILSALVMASSCWGCGLRGGTKNNNQ